MDSCGDEGSGGNRKGDSRKRCGLGTLSAVSERCHWKSSDHVFSLATVLGFGHLVHRRTLSAWVTEAARVHLDQAEGGQQ